MCRCPLSILDLNPLLSGASAHAPADLHRKGVAALTIGAAAHTRRLIFLADNPS
jgi:hypothetical protein